MAAKAREKAGRTQKKGDRGTRKTGCGDQDSRESGGDDRGNTKYARPDAALPFCWARYRIHEGYIQE
jgi:hypothetical protein